MFFINFYQIKDTEHIDHFYLVIHLALLSIPHDAPPADVT